MFKDHTRLEESTSTWSRNGNSQASIAFESFNFDDQSSIPSKKEIPHLSISIDSPSTIRSPPKPAAGGLTSPPPTTLRSLPRAIRQPIGNTIKFPSTRSFSSASSRSFSSSGSTSPSTTSLLHPSTAPIPTLRHSSASLFELLNSQDHGRCNQRAHYQTLPSPYLLKPFISDQSSPQPLSPKSPNSIKFPSCSPTTTTFTLISPTAPSGPNPQDSLDWLITHWLTSTFVADPTDSEDDQEAVPELDLLVGFKSITDQLNLPPLDRDQAWSALCHVFPTAESWARPTPAGLRSNKEFVVKGIKLKEQAQNEGYAKDLTRTVRTSMSETNHNAQIIQPFRQLDFSKPIPDEAHSKELIEYMRKRICALELQSQLRGVQASSNRRKLLKHPPHKFAYQIKKQYNPPHRLFRFDHQSTHTDRPGKDLVHVLGERIWLSLIKVCKHTKDNFLNGERLTASWVEHMNKSEFDLIVKNTKSQQNRTIETSRSQFITIIYPFQKSNHVKLFKFQPIADFNAIVYNDDRRSNLIHGHPDRKAFDDPILKDLKIIQILPSSVLMRERFDQQQRVFTTTSKRNLPKLINSNSHKGYETTTNGHSKRKVRGKSLDLFSSPTALFIKQQQHGETGKVPKEGSSIGDLFETLNHNFREQRKSLNLDKLFNHHQNRQPVKHNLVETLEVSYPDRPNQSILIVEEIVIEFNLLFLNQLKFQIKLTKEEA